MTNKEAVYELKRKLPAKVFGTELYCEAYDLAIEALAKQIPKKIKLIHKVDPFGMHFNDAVCDCGCSFYYIGRVNYCPMCGQAIEWSGTD